MKVRKLKRDFLIQKREVRFPKPVIERKVEQELYASSDLQKELSRNRNQKGVTP